MNYKLLTACTFALMLTACSSTDNQLAHQVNILGERVDTLTEEVNALKKEQAASQKAISNLESQVQKNTQRVNNVSKTFKK